MTIVLLAWGTITVPFLADQAGTITVEISIISTF